MQFNQASLLHPNVHPTASAWSEDQKLYLACMYSNPTRWQIRRELFNDFRKRMEATPNVVLYVGEAAFGDRPFEVTSSDNPRDIQFRTEDELWLKENVLNLVIHRLPSTAQYIGYIDGDVLMTRYDWALEAVHLLQHYSAVQLFSQFTDVDVAHRPISVTRGFAYNYAHHILPPVYHPNIFGYDSPEMKPPTPVDNHGSGKKTVSVTNPHLTSKANTVAAHINGYGPSMKVEQDSQLTFTGLWGATGLGWAFRKEAWEAMNGLMDFCILGSADWHMAYGMAGLANTYSHEDFKLGSQDPYVQAIQVWQSHASALEANIWYLDNHIIHYWHGPKSNRFYRERSKILSDNEFNPSLDLKRDWQGIMKLAGNKPKLRDDIRAYFRARNEDDPNLGEGQRPIV